MLSLLNQPRVFKIVFDPLKGVSHQKRFRTGQRHVPTCALGRRAAISGCACGCSLFARTDWYDKYFAYAMATGMEEYEEVISPFKRQLFDRLWLGDAAPKDILDVGIGTGPNLKFFAGRPVSPLLTITGIDPNPQMASYALEQARKVGLEEGQLRILPGLAEDLPLPDNCMDACVCTLVLCSVRDVPRALQEISRVLRPGGTLLFVEHVYASADQKLLQFAQRTLSPLQQLLADGCHLDRDPLPVIGGVMDLVEVQRITVDGLGLIGPQVGGLATVRL